MRQLILFFLFVGCCASANAQYQRLNLSDNTLSIEISLIENKCILNESNSNISGHLQRVDASLENGDLVIGFDLRKGENDQNYRLSLEADINGQELAIFQEDLIGDIGKELQTRDQGGYKIIWTRLFERYVDLDGILTLRLQTELWGTPKLPFGIECGKPPLFGAKQRLPHIITAGAGLASLGVSLVFEKRSNDTYDNDYLTQNFEEQAEPFYQKANDDHKNGLLLRYTGTAILALDAIWYIYRSIRHKKKLNAYNESCAGNSAIQFSPLIELNTSPAVPSQVGFSFTYQFGR